MDRDQKKRRACAACKYQRRRCPQDCVLAPYFPGDRPLDFINVHRVFRRDYLEKQIKDTELHSRESLMNAIKIEANARVSDPPLGICRLICQLKTLIHEAEQELYHTSQQLVFHRVHGQGGLAAPSNLQESMNVPPNPYGQVGHPLDFYHQFPTSWTSTCENDAGYSLLGPFQNQPNPPFSLAESVHHGIAPSTSLSQTFYPFLASSAQPIQNQSTVQLSSSSGSEQDHEDELLGFLDFD